MKRIYWIICFLLPLQLLAQDTTGAAKDSTIANLMKDMNASGVAKKLPVKIFSSDKVITANTTETVGKGKMDFKVTHNFGDIAGDAGGIKNFFGLDVSTDVRIGFNIGLTDRLDLSLAHAKGDERDLQSDSVPFTGYVLPLKLYEVSLKYQLLRQYENDPSHPIALSVFVQSVVSTQPATKINNVVIPDKPASFETFGDRITETVQIIIAKKIGKISVQLNPTLVHYGYVPSFDEPTTLALGAALRVPVSPRVAIIIDYFHPFLSDTKKSNFNSLHTTGVRPYNINGIRFFDPLSVGFEFLTAGHVFHLNFTNTTGIMENHFIPYNTNSWGRGEFRWGFNLSRKFSLWRPKNKA